MRKRNFKNYAEDLNKALKSADEEKINLLYEEIKKRMDGNSSIYIMGNGGSAANGSHICGDFLKTFALLDQKIKIFNITDSASYYTAAVNDTDQCDVFALLIGKLILKNDLIIFLSGSGNSINLVKAAQKAKILGITTVSITAYTGGALRNISEIPIHININDMEIAEDAQLSLFHYIKQELNVYIDSLINNKEDSLKSDKYLKRVSNDLIA